MKKNDVLKKQNIGNQGMSLVEVIVSLLIVAVIFTPLLLTFVQTSKVNHRTNVMSYADDAADNIMEQIKAYGVEGYALHYAEQYGEDSTPYVQSGKFLKPTDGVYTYEISGIAQGTLTYDAKITLSSGAYKTEDSDADPTPTPGINDYIFADFSPFSSDKTVLIFPKTADTVYIPEGVVNPTPKIYAGFDDKGVSYFMNMNEERMERLYSDKRTEIEKENSKIKADNASAILTNPAATPIPTKPLPSRIPTYQTASRSTILSGMKRTITIEVRKNQTNNAQQAAGVGFEVSSTVKYTASNSGRLYDGDASNNPEVVYRGYCTNVYVKEIESIFLLYTEPFSDAIDDEIQVISDCGEDFDIYIAVQVDPELADDPDRYPDEPIKISESLTNHTEVHYYSQAPINVAAEKKTDSLIKMMETASDRLYEIKIEIYEHGTTDLVTSLTSSYVNDTEIK